MFFFGCVDNEFETVQPPIKEFPAPNEYELTEAFTGTLIVNKTFSGNKIGADTLFLQSDTRNNSGFYVGENGYVTYNKMGKSYTVEAKIVSCPSEGTGEFIAKHEPLNEVPEHFPGTFWTTVTQIDDCLMIDKHAVVLLDDDGSALIHKTDENGLLCDCEISVGICNSDYYQVLSGLSEGETAVMR